MKKEIKIGDKIISMDRASTLIDKIFAMRSSGSTQEEVAKQLGVERSFISHLEGIGEVRKSKEIAFIGSGVADAGRVESMVSDLNFEHVFINADGTAHIEDALGVLAILKEIDFIVFLGPATERKLLETVLEKKIVGITLDKEEKLDEVLSEFAGKRTRRAYRSVRRGEIKGDAKRSGQRKHWIVEPGPRSRG
jgi:transcriptional regulator with XRE-family HTH domain